MSALGHLRRRMLGIPSAESISRRPGFAPEARERFQPVARSLVEGYHAALENSHLPVLVPWLDAVDPPFQGFAYEGAGMGLAALDVMAPYRLDEFVAGPGARHIYLVYVGIGLALARLKRSPERRLVDLDPLLGQVIIDGYGFHEGFFAHRRYIVDHTVPRYLSGYGQRVFDQGLGRAIWFSRGAVIDRVATTVDGFPAARHVDLWSGVGLASAYAGGADRASLERLLAVATGYRAQLARGAATAAWGRQLAGNTTAHTELACEVVCGTSGVTAVAVLEQARRDLPAGGAEPAYDVWRKRTEAAFAATWEQSSRPTRSADLGPAR